MNNNNPQYILLNEYIDISPKISKIRSKNVSMFYLFEEHKLIIRLLPFCKDKLIKKI